MFILFFTVGPYLKRPVLTNTLPAGQQPVTGVTVLFDQVFVLRRVTPGVEVYDSNTLHLTSRLPVDGLVYPKDLTSCSMFQCLYIADWDGEVMHRVELDGATTRWKVNGLPYGLSVTPDPDFHLLVTCYVARKLKEFTTNGTLVRQILLQDDLAHPLHAIQFDGQFIVSHGLYFDFLNRVCVVNSTGHVTRCYGGQRGSAAGQLSEPLHLAVDEEGNVLVADFYNDRVLLLSKTLDYVRELVSAQNMKPSRLCLDVSRGRLFVSDGSQTEVLVYKIRDE